MAFHLTRKSCHCGGGLGHGCSCSTGDAGAQCQIMEKMAMQERGQMQALNDRLAAYVSRVRQMRTQATTTPSGYRESLQALETEIVSVKELYEAELARLRSLLEDTSRSGVSVLSQLEQVNISSSQYQARYDEEVQRVRNLNDELQRLRISLTQERKELAEVRISLAARENELRDLRPGLQRLQQENDELKRRLEVEMSRALQSVEEIKITREKTGFDVNAKAQYIRDLEERLRASNSIVISLETRINQLTQTDTFDINAVLKKLREGSALELQHYQQETETALQRSLQSLRCQIEQEVHAKCALGQEKDDLDTKVRRLQGVIAELEAKVATTQKLRLEAEEALAAEKKRCQNMTVTLERRIRELQEGMMCKLQECTGARDAQMSLKMEIDAFKSLIEAEEKQLNQVSVQSQSVVNSADASRCLPLLRRRPVTPTYNINTFTPSYQYQSYGQISTSYNNATKQRALPTTNRTFVSFPQFHPGSAGNYGRRGE